jgi:hypothetical protein
MAVRLHVPIPDNSGMQRMGGLQAGKVDARNPCSEIIHSCTLHEASLTCYSNALKVPQRYFRAIPMQVRITSAYIVHTILYKIISI